VGDFSIKALLGIDSKDADGKLKSTGGKFGKLGGIAAKAGMMAADAILKAAKAFVDFAVDATKAFMQFEKGMAEVFTLLPGKSAEAKDKMKADILEVGAEYGFMTEDTIPALYQALSAGIPEGNVMEFLEGAAKLSIAGCATLTESVGLLTKVTNAYGDAAGTTEHQAAILFSTVKNGTTTVSELSASMGDVLPIASAAGVSFEETAAAMAALTNITGNTAKASTQLKAALSELAKPGSQAAMAFEEAAKGSKFAGMSFIEAMEKGMTLKEGLKMMEDHGIKTGKSFFEMFGSVEAGAGVMALATDDFANLTKATKDQANANSDLLAATEEMRGTWEFEVKQMQARWEKFMIMFGEMMGPILEAVGPIIDALLTMLEELPWEEFEEEVEALGEAIKEAFGSDEAKDEMKTWVMAIFNAVKLVIRFVAAILKVRAALSKLGIGKLLSLPLKLAMAVLEFVINLLSSLADILAGTKSGLKALAKQFGLSDEAAQEFADGVIEATKFIRDAISYVGDVLTGVLDWFKSEFLHEIFSGLGGMVAFIRQDGDDIGSIAKNTGKGVLAIAVGTISKIVTAISDLVSWIFDTIGDLVSWIFDKGDGVGQGMYDMLPDWAQRTIDRIWNFITEFYDDFMDVLGSIWDWFETHFPWLTNLVERALDVVRSALDWVYDKVMFVFGTLKEWYDTVMGWLDDIDEKTDEVSERVKEEERKEEERKREKENEKKRKEFRDKKQKEKEEEEEKEKAKKRQKEIEEEKRKAIDEGRKKRNRAEEEDKRKKEAKKKTGGGSTKEKKEPRHKFEKPPGFGGLKPVGGPGGDPAGGGWGGGGIGGGGGGIGGGGGGIGQDCCKEISENVGGGDDKKGEKDKDEEKELSDDCTTICDEPNGIKIRSEKPLEVEQTQTKDGALKVFIVEGTAPIKVLEQNLPLPVFIEEGAAPILVKVVGVLEPIHVHVDTVAQPIPVFITEGTAPIRVILEPNLQLDHIFKVLAVVAGNQVWQVEESNFHLEALIASQILLIDLAIQLNSIMRGKKIAPEDDCACLRLTEISHSSSVTATNMMDLLGHTKKIDNNIAAIRKRLDGCISNQ